MSFVEARVRLSVCRERSELIRLVVLLDVAINLEKSHMIKRLKLLIKVAPHSSKTRCVKAVFVAFPSSVLTESDFFSVQRASVENPRGVKNTEFLRLVQVFVSSLP